MGEKWWPNGVWDMHPVFFYMPQICDMGPIILIPFRRMACSGFLSPFKNPTASAGFEPANLGIRSQHATSALIFLKERPIIHFREMVNEVHWCNSLVEHTLN